MRKGWLCVPAIYDKNLNFHFRLAVSVCMGLTITVGDWPINFLWVSSLLIYIPKKQKVKEDILKKQENLMNSNKQSSPVVKNTLIPEEPHTTYQNLPPSVTRWN